MKKIMIAFAAAFALLAATLAQPNPAEAKCRWNCALAIGVGAAVVGAALAPRYQPYAVQPGYQPYGAYYAAAPVDCPGGYWGRRIVGQDQWGNPIYGKPRFFCPAY